MKKIIISLVLLCLLTVVAVAIIQKTSNAPQVSNMVTPPRHTGEPVFTWQYNEFEKDMIPQSTISVNATYPDGTNETKVIDTIEGGCNVYENRDEDVYPKSDMIICYYAGLGHYFKIVKSGEGYLVQRKIFEEGSPDYTPPELPFETVTTF